MAQTNCKRCGGNIFITAVMDQCVCLVHTVGSTNPIQALAAGGQLSPSENPNSVLKAQSSALFPVSTLGRFFEAI